MWKFLPILVIVISCTTGQEMKFIPVPEHTVRMVGDSKMNHMDLFWAAIQSARRRCAENQFKNFALSEVREFVETISNGISYPGVSMKVHCY